MPKFRVLAHIVARMAFSQAIRIVILMAFDARRTGALRELLS
jgi:hypothetical protein